MTLKKIISLVAILFATSTAFADLDIKKENHIQNNEVGKCAWCTIESLGLTQGWTAIKGLTASKNAPAYNYQIDETLRKFNITHKTYQIDVTEWWYIVCYQEKGKNPVVDKCLRTQKEANDYIKNSKKEGTFYTVKEYYRKTAFLFDCIKKEMGVGISIDHFKIDPKGERHMLVAVGVDDDEVRCVDSNFAPGKIRKIPLRDFLIMWNGHIVIIEPKPVEPKLVDKKP